MPEKYTLRYFNVMGFGEPIRLLLSYGDAEFEDFRIDHRSDEWLKMKPTMPFGQLPVLEIDDKVYSQTLPICRYLAKKYNLLGKTDLDALQIDAIVNALYDFRKHITSFYRETDEALKVKKKTQILSTVVPFYLERFEELVSKNNGYLYNGKLTYADIFFAGIADSASVACGFDITQGKTNLKSLKEKILTLPGIKEWVEKRPTYV